MLVIIDYGMGNIRSVQKALKRIGVEAKISTSENDIETAGKLILPGVGHFRNGIENIKKLGLFEVLNKKVIEDKTPIMGICLGMQLFTNYSEEGDAEGFGWINGKTMNFKFPTPGLKVPHMGWNNLVFEKSCSLYEGIEEENSFYFVHSYYVECNNNQEILSKTTYGNEFVSSFQKDNIFGVQYHPEKSHGPGLKILSNFCKIN